MRLSAQVFLRSAASQPQEDAERHVHGEGHDGQHERVAQPLEHHRPDKRIHARRRAPVAAHVAPEPARVLHRHRPVETELVAQLGPGLLGGEAAEGLTGHVAGQDGRRPEDDDRRQDDREHHEAEAPEDELPIRRPLPGRPERVSRPVAGRAPRAGCGSRCDGRPRPRATAAPARTQTSPRKRGQRGWKRQPEGTSIALGTEPPRRMGFCLMSGSASGIGREQRLRVGVEGRREHARGVADLHHVAEVDDGDGVARDAARPRGRAR